jgi:uroporphyrinogen decarboxylase
MALGEVGINKLADAIIEYDSAFLQRSVKAGVDCIAFGDDYGTERAMLMSPELWRSFIKPRLKRLFQPAVDAGLDIHFHSCGQVFPILGDLAEIGVTSIWPQLPAYNMVELAKHCRSLGLAVEVHTDRAYTMTHGTPQEVRELVKREFETFRMQDGGAWFYVEADNGFPYANLEALVQTIAEYR